MRAFLSTESIGTAICLGMKELHATNQNQFHWIHADSKHLPLFSSGRLRASKQPPGCQRHHKRRRICAWDKRWHGGRGRQSLSDVRLLSSIATERIKRPPIRKGRLKEQASLCEAPFHVKQEAVQGTSGVPSP